MRRLGIFVLYDTEGIVDRYVDFLAVELRKNLSSLLIVSNFTLRPKDRKRLEKYADFIVERKNKGYDAGAIKDVLTNYFSKEDLEKYDELLLINDTVYGPLFPLHEVFDSMSANEVDFWGLTYDQGAYTVPGHLQSYFLVIRHKMLTSQEFMDFWHDMPYFDNFEDVLSGYENTFTQHFASRGFRYKAYIDSSAYAGTIDRMTINPFYHLLNESLYQGLPFVKRKPMTFRGNDLRLDSFSRRSFVEALHRLDNQDFYDTSMIWENLLRCYDIEDIQRSCNLRWVLNPDTSCSESNLNIILVWQITAAKLWPDVFRKMQNLEGKILQVIYLSDEINNIECLNSMHMIDVRRGNWQGWYDILSDCMPGMKENLVLCISDGDFATLSTNYANRESFCWQVLENLACSYEYMVQMQNLFKNKEHLGILVSPYPSGGVSLGDEYRAKGFLDKHCSFISRRTLIDSWQKIIKNNGIVTDDDNVYLRGMANHVARQGFYAGVVQSSVSAAVDLENFQGMINDIFAMVQGEDNIRDCFDVRRILCETFGIRSKLKKFSKKHSRLFAYGTGEEASRAVYQCVEYEAYIVSDGRHKQESFMGRPVKWISEIEVQTGDGIVLALNREHIKQVLPVLNELEVDYLIPFD